MSLVIRLTHIGRKGERRFRVVVKEKRSKRDGKALDMLGWYIKTATGDMKEIDAKKAAYWISKGAKASPTVEKLLQ